MKIRNLLILLQVRKSELILYSTINAAIKIEFINEFIQSIRSSLNFSEEQIHELRDININFIHSQYWRRLIDYKLEQIQFEKY